MTSDYQYRLVHSRGARPVLGARDLHVEVETTGVPPGGVRYRFATRYRPSKSSYRDVLLERILEMCKAHKLTPLEIRSADRHGYVDVIFANGDDVIKVYDKDISFDFYGTQPELFERATPDRRHVAMCIQTLPSSTNLNDVQVALKDDVRMRKAGQIVDIWSLHCPASGQFKGKVLVLLELHTRNGEVTLDTRAAIPGWFVFNGIAYLVRFPDRPTWCFTCRYDTLAPFHSMHTCPKAPCRTCKRSGHASVECKVRRAQVAKKQQGGRRATEDSSDDDEDETPRAPSNDRASMERRFAELGIRDRSEEAEELARDFGVLALSESDIGS
ncbi:hypothetical protein PSEUBRA_004337 [Kalmanozyma brasiliensis GHG001]|uniref:CCHC-type domain-containing protein n=1 Tax=Kalmanozyma brasiliensis (strain GHG001) TaxID=1365824 RepID=V5ETN8_KALBG|nr:uncharacterized protein PSEUBRA_004337 [Kalmanozyma brasiliensis GHG001]EST06438.1 hypothetical protein PSEUBRA_004337 [Kalmanozyma brasiliensis GHG001]